MHWVVRYIHFNNILEVDCHNQSLLVQFYYYIRIEFHLELDVRNSHEYQPVLSRFYHFTECQLCTLSHYKPQISFTV